MGTSARPSKFFLRIETDKSARDHRDEARAACFDVLSRMDDRQSGIGERCDFGSSGRSRKIAGPGCRRERHCSGTGECARTQRLGQRSQRHRQRGQSACDTTASNKPRQPAHRVGPYCLPNVAGAASGKDETNAICGFQIPSRGGPSDRQRARQAARPQDYKHLPGMLNSLGLACCSGIEDAADFGINRWRLGILDHLPLSL